MSAIDVISTLTKAHGEWYGDSYFSFKMADADKKKTWKFVNAYARNHNFTVFVTDLKKSFLNVKKSPVKEFPFNWDGMNMWITNDTNEAIHEICHHMVCYNRRTSAIDVPEYGLGAGPGTELMNVANKLRTLTVDKSEKEEYAVCLLAGFVAKNIGINPFPVWEYASCFTGGKNDEEIFKQNVEAFKMLRNCGIINNEGNVIIND